MTGKHTLRRMAIFSFIAMFAVSCGLFRKMPEGAPPFMRKKNLLEEVRAAENDFERLRLSGKGSFKDGSKSQRFRFDIRLRKDSLIWVDLADPLLGLKVARAVIYKDSVAFYNKLNSKYLSGDLSSLQKKIGFEADFGMLMAALSGNLVVPPNDAMQVKFEPGHYLLTDYDVDPEQGPVQSGGTFHEYTFDPDTYKASQQKRLEPTRGKTFTLNFDDFKVQGNNRIPQKIQFEYRHNETTEVELEVRSIDLNGNFGFPFNIPKRYAPM